MQLASFLDARDILIEQRILTKEQVYQQLGTAICKHHPLPICGNGLLDLILHGQDVAGILPEAGVLLGFAALFFFIGIWRFRYE